MLGMVTPPANSPIGHHIVSLIMSYFTLRLRPQKAIRAPWLAYGWIILAQFGLAAKTCKMHIAVFQDFIFTILKDTEWTAHSY